MALTYISSLFGYSAKNVISSGANNGDWVKYIPLHRAILENNWDKTQEIISMHEGALRDAIDENGQTALHVAVGDAVPTPKSILFLEKLLENMTPESLVTLKDAAKCNPLHRAAIAGNTKATEKLVNTNKHWLFCWDNDNALPVHRAAYNSQEDTFKYLLEACKEHIEISKQEGYHSPFEGTTGAMLLIGVISAGYLGFAYELVKDYPNLARSMDVTGNFSPLLAIAKKFDAYRSGKRYNFYQSFVYSCVKIKKDNVRYTHRVQDIENHDEYRDQFVEKYKSNYFYSVIYRKIFDKFWDVALIWVPHIKQLREDKVKHNNALRILKCICQEVDELNTFQDIFGHYGNAFGVAVTNDTFEVVKEILEHFPQVVWATRNNYGVFQLAITNRCEKVYNFLVHKVIYGVQYHKAGTDQYNNNLLHLTGKLAPIHKLNLVSGAALQMKRELQWFEAVENFIPHAYKEGVNNEGDTPLMVFRKEHTQLRKDGEEWLKKTAEACTITAALIITIVFAAAITVPGGDDNGKPNYASKPSFIIFAVSDAISLFSSTTSLLLFLFILTARYRDEDFKYNLPQKLILGLATLFLSLTSMMVAFSATLYIMFGQGKEWVLIPIAILTCLPIASFGTLQLPLLVDLVSLTYGNGILGKPSD